MERKDKAYINQVFETFDRKLKDSKVGGFFSPQLKTSAWKTVSTTKN
ncbi:hypothetical protein ACK2M7_05005 [Chryseobacterium sp. TY4]